MTTRAEHLIVMLFSLLATSAAISQSGPGDAVEFSKDLGPSGVLRVIRSQVAPTTAQATATTQPLAQQTSTPTEPPAETVARYRFMLSSKSAPQERQLFFTTTFRGPGDPSRGYHTYAAEVVDESLLVVVYKHEGNVCFHVIELDPQKPARGLPALPSRVLRISDAFGTPDVQSVDIQGSLENGTLAVAATADVSSRDFSTRERKVLRFTLKRTDKGWDWVSIP